MEYFYLVHTYIFLAVVYYRFTSKTKIMKLVSVREFRNNLQKYLKEPCSVTSRGKVIASIIPYGRKLVIHEKVVKSTTFRDIPNVIPDIDENLVIEPLE